MIVVRTPLRLSFVGGGWGADKRYLLLVIRVKSPLRGVIR